eukprot:tig00000017_g6.t1
MYRLRLSQALSLSRLERERLAERGLDYFNAPAVAPAPFEVGVFFGPASGPKFCATAGFEHAARHAELTGRKYFIGASAGALRFTALLLSRMFNQDITSVFEERYAGIRYAKGDLPPRTTAEFGRTLDALCEPERVAALLSPENPHSLCILVSRVKEWAGSLSPVLQKLAGTPFLIGNYAGAAGARLQVLLYERLCFYTGPEPPSALLHRVQNSPVELQFYRLTPENFRPALHASCAIPFIIEPVTEIPGTGPGLYIDGGLADYQLNVAVEAPALLLSHSRNVKATWMDVWVPGKRPHPACFEHCSVVWPGADLVGAFPGGSVPTKRDWERWAGPDLEHERIRRWLGSIQKSREAWPADLLAGCSVERHDGAPLNPGESGRPGPLGSLRAAGEALRPAVEALTTLGVFARNLRPRS